MKDIITRLFVLVIIFAAINWPLLLLDEEMERRRRERSTRIPCTENLTMKTTRIFTLISHLHHKF
eukprot:snap_masked-scaffold_13-processed-gene-0.21-mRNA-1 protein AED:1.00 eAED:1.00 QI:0/0/0/0/1/1/2/0/64